MPIAAPAAQAATCDYPPSHPSLTVAVGRVGQTPSNSVKVYYGTTVVVSGFFTRNGCGLGGETIVIVSRHAGGGSYETLGSDVTNSHGSFAISYQALEWRQIRADFRGDPAATLDAQDSNTAVVQVVRHRC